MSRGAWLGALVGVYVAMALLLQLNGGPWWCGLAFIPVSLVSVAHALSTSGES